MDELIGKLAGLSYDIFGIWLPGVLASLFLVLFWAALGDLMPVLTFAELAAALGLSGDNDVGGWLRVGAVGLATYLVGHMLLWISRDGKETDEGLNGWKRIGLFLIFKIPKGASYYHSALDPLFHAVAAKLGTSQALTWRQLYPVARSYLALNHAYSLVSTYQNRYTFHRSVTTAAVLLFWLTLAAIIVGAFTHCLLGLDPKWTLLGLLLCGSLLLVWGLSASYLFYWRMFGDAVVAESYGLLFAPKKDERKH